MTNPINGATGVNAQFAAEAARAQVQQGAEAASSIIQDTIQETASHAQATVADTAEKIAEAVNSEAQEADGSEQTSYFAWAKEGFDSFVNQTVTSAGNFYSDLSGKVSQFSTDAQAALSYNGLSNAGRNAFESTTGFLSNVVESVTTSSPVVTAGEWISTGTEKITHAANSAAEFSVNNYLPASVFALGAITAGYSIKKSAESFRTNHIGRSFVQLLVGASAAALAGSIAYQSVGQSVEASIKGLFSKA